MGPASQPVTSNLCWAKLALTASRVRDFCSHTSKPSYPPAAVNISVLIKICLACRGQLHVGHVHSCLLSGVKLQPSPGQTGALLGALAGSTDGGLAGVLPLGEDAPVAMLESLGEQMNLLPSPTGLNPKSFRWALMLVPFDCAGVLCWTQLEPGLMIRRSSSSSLALSSQSHKQPYDIGHAGMCGSTYTGAQAQPRLGMFDDMLGHQGSILHVPLRCFTADSQPHASFALNVCTKAEFHPSTH